MFTDIYSQLDIKGENEISDQLSSQAKKKIAKSDKILEKAYVFDKKIEQYEQQIESLKNAGKVKIRKIEHLENKRNSAILQSKPLYQDAFKLRSKAYNKELQKINNPVKQITDLNNKANSKYREAKKLFNKADNTAKTSSQVELIVQGREKYIESISNLVQALNYNAQPTEPLVAEKKDTIPETQTETVPVKNEIPTVTANVQTSPPPTPAATPVTVAAVSTPIIPEKTNQKPESDPIILKDKAPGSVFLSVQVLATNKPATPEQIKSVYKGSLKVMEFKSGQYYRYNIGKFRTVDEAKKFIAINNLKGFVVGYNNSERISVSEAINLMASGN